ncbi:cysteine hydrolase family protein [Streptomyces sp. TS71-3]|uniref:cysteine hydrolase family protein n=1 Tax=Streptomyces sp. TS71-3 TaxID=2733862 RepID=UPI001B1EA5DD|nr:isochorismatase family protein [Streptomyces sp. TS71-3]GHJ41521.1 N-carbamoylsarcosine amidase [Streptomyces sp. TS71-3]
MRNSDIWEPFLTEQDRAHLGRQQRPERGIGPRPALVLVDIYQRVFGDRPEPLLDALERWPSSCGPAGWDALPHIVAVLGAARDAGIPVVHVTGAADLPAWRRVPRGGRSQDREAREAGFRIKEEAAPLPGEPVLRKAAPSAFFGTPLVALLRQYDVDNVIVVGESTSGCVRATVVDACSYRYDVTVVRDAVFDRTQAAHAINLFDMAQKYADVRGSQDVVADLAELAA